MLYYKKSSSCLRICKILYLSALALLLNCCTNKQKTTNDNVYVDTIAVKSAIFSKYENAKNVDISFKFIDYIDIYWNDPSYIKGPNVDVESDCWIVRFQADTYESDTVLLYTDYYELLIPENDSVSFLKNRFHGLGYHGNSCILLKSENDNRYNNRAPLIRIKDRYVIDIESILKE